LAENRGSAIELAELKAKIEVLWKDSVKFSPKWNYSGSEWRKLSDRSLNHPEQLISYHWLIQFIYPHF